MDDRLPHLTLLKSQFQLFSLAPINPDHRLLLICHVQLMGKPDRSAAPGSSGTDECASEDLFGSEIGERGTEPVPLGFVIRQKMATKA
jgi:hypothetical protein